MFLISVPTPTLDLSVPSGPLYEGTSQTLTCTVTLPDTVDTDVTVDVSSSVVDGLVLLPQLKIAFPNSTEISVMNTSSLGYMFSPLRTSDGGQYTCTATVNIPQAGITDLESSITESITVEGIYEPLWSAMCDCCIHNAMHRCTLSHLSVRESVLQFNHQHLTVPLIPNRLPWTIPLTVKVPLLLLIKFPLTILRP